MAGGYDVAIIGSGINALVCAALLGKRGKRVLVLERNDQLGGCLRTEALTAPGFLHDVMATTFVLFRVGPANAALGEDLARHGVEFCDTDAPTAVLRPDGSAAVLHMDRAKNMVMFEGLAQGDSAGFANAADDIGANADLIFALLGQGLWTRKTATLLAREAWRRGPRNLLAFMGGALGTARGWLESDFQSETARALFAPWVLHCGLGPESAYSAQMARVIAFTLEVAGAPIIKGGAARMVDGLRAIIEENGGSLRTGADVSEIVVANGTATGVRLSDGEVVAAGKVVASVTPTQLYGRLIAQPSEAAQEATRTYRYGKGNFQLHYALNAPPKWNAPGLENVALVHLTPGLDGVSRAANEAERGQLPAEPTICVGQPTALDPSRAPEGQAILWLQMPEAPRHVKGDAAGKIPVGNGTWTTELREAYANRIEDRLAQHIDGFRDTVIARRPLSPADLESMNMNLVGGDPYGGYCGLDQFFAWRPFKGSRNHATEIKNLLHIGASTHPGPGLGAGSGVLASGAIR
ncbi:MAG: FAD-dependent oxidoreductase [Pseudooceanicola sp.]|jgi:phytoene dehydrogenase-like protein|nr:FAD-dependent oxidoreductase [Pseudooceanicola sp.]